MRAARASTSFTAMSFTSSAPCGAMDPSTFPLIVGSSAPELSRTSIKWADAAAWADTLCVRDGWRDLRCVDLGLQRRALDLARPRRLQLHLRSAGRHHAAR